MKDENKNKPFHLATFTFREGIGWRLRRTRITDGQHCAVAFCRRQRRSDRKSRLCHTCETREYRANNPVRTSYHRLKGHAKQRRILFDLTYDQFAKFVGAGGSRYLDRKRGFKRAHFSIDRIENRKGYTEGNLQLLTTGENSRKWNLVDKPNGHNYPF